jgi:glutamate dehydrogenase
MNDRTTSPPRTTDRGEPAEVIDQVVTHLKDRLPAAQLPVLEAFVRRYYADVDAEDLAERSAEDLYGAALSHWHFARSLRRQQAKLRVYNPRVDEHGWQSTHTVVEIVNDDMPFLVDSVTMEVNRQG